jgi:hypothetical protein
LDEILSSNRSPKNNTGVGYTQDSTTTSKGSTKSPMSYSDTIKISLRREDNKGKMIPLKTVPHKQKSTLPTRIKDDNKKTITRRNSPNKMYLLDIVTLAVILNIRQYTANLMDNTIVEMSKDIRTISATQRRKTITHLQQLWT